MAKSNWQHNHPKVTSWLNDNDIEYIEYNAGLHLKILGATAYVELWPSKMTYHIIQSEHPSASNKYGRLSPLFVAHELDDLLNH